jgi:hypothetical protein
MATLRSNLYELAENQVDYIYRGPSGATVGNVTVRTGSYTGTIANTDVLKLAGGFKENEKAIFISIVQSADGDTDNDLVFDLGWTSDTDEFLNDSTGLQSTTAVELDYSNLAAADVAAAGDEILLTAHTGEAEASVTYRFMILSTIV